MYILSENVKVLIFFFFAVSNKFDLFYKVVPIKFIIQQFAFGKSKESLEKDILFHS